MDEGEIEIIKEAVRLLYGVIGSNLESVDNDDIELKLIDAGLLSNFYDDCINLSVAEQKKFRKITEDLDALHDKMMKENPGKSFPIGDKWDRLGDIKFEWWSKRFRKLETQFVKDLIKVLIE